ncbi:hypothetical protein GEMRC1_008320 [Eukaryota sp. GEM-RC1]
MHKKKPKPRGGCNPAKVKYASFRQPDRALAFIRAALADPNLTEILHNLLEHQTTTLDVLLEAQFSLYSESSKTSLSVQRIAVGFLKLLDPNRLNIVPPREVSEFLAKLSASPFISSVLNQLMLAVEEGWQEKAAQPEDWCVNSISEALLLVCVTIDSIYTNKPEVAGNPQFLSWRNLIKLLISDLEELESGSEAPFIEEVKHHSSQFKIFSNRYKEIRSLTHKEQSITRSTAPTDDPISDGPGQLGHDNDHVNYRDIVVLPTSGEVEFLINGSGSVWLPRSNTRYNYFENEVDRLLDKQYRLLRHELLFPLTVVLSNLSIVFGKVEASEDQKSSYDHVAAQIQRRSLYVKNLVSIGSQESFSMISVYNADIHTVSGDIHHGVVFRASFDIPSSAPKLHPMKQFDSWLTTRASRLFSNSQIGVYYHSPSNSFFLFTITRGVELSDGRLVLACSVPKTEAFRFGNCLNACYSQRLSPEESGQFMLFVPAVFLSNVASRVERSILIDNQKLTSRCRSSSLIKRKKLIKNDSLSVLDPTQLDSLFHCLSHNVSLIQGPPGTGKSFLGKFIVKLLVNQPRTPKPILILSYSNHALDSFLLDLINEGIVSQKEITKLGSHTKSEQLEDCLLKQQARAATGRTGKSTVSRLRTELTDLDVQRISKSRVFIYDYKYLRKELLDLTIYNADVLNSCIAFLVHFIRPPPNKDGFIRPVEYCQHDYNTFLKGAKSYVSKYHPELASFFGVEPEMSNYGRLPPVRPCPNFLFGPKCSPQCTRGIHDRSLSRFRKSLCKFWMIDGKCTKGHSCKRSFSHRPYLLPPVLFPKRGYPCPFFFCKDNCRYNECELSHDPQWHPFETFLCFHYLQGHCRKGIHCPDVLGHDPDLLPPYGFSAVESVDESKLAGYSHEFHVVNQFISKYLVPTNGEPFMRLPAEVQIAQYLAIRREICLHKLNEFEHLFNEISTVSEDYKKAYFHDNLDLLSKQTIIGATTSVACKQLDLLQAVSAKVCIVEEAGEVLEAHVLTALNKSINHLILIGDHQQLKPKINLYQLKMESNKGWNLDMSLFERLISKNFPFCTLLTQYRMRPEISSLIKPFYPQFTIEDGPNVHEYPQVKGMKHSLMFFNHNQPEDGDHDDLSRSKTNQFEGQMAVNLALYLMHQGYVGEDIAIVTPYLGQMFVLREILKSTSIDIILSEGDAAELADLEDQNEAQIPRQQTSKAVTGPALGQVKLATIDTFQGLEATIVIVSLTSYWIFKI